MIPERIGTREAPLVPAPRGGTGWGIEKRCCTYLQIQFAFMPALVEAGQPVVVDSKSSHLLSYVCLLFVYCISFSTSSVRSTLFTLLSQKQFKILGNIEMHMIKYPVLIELAFLISLMHIVIKLLQVLEVI